MRKEDCFKRNLRATGKGTSEGINGLGPWYEILQNSEESEKHYETLLLDLIEAYEFISEYQAESEERDSDESIN